jgi:glycerophosphoryl diester phosphodiesterase
MGLLTMNGIPGVLGRSFLFRKISPNYIHPEIKDVSIAYISSEHDHHRKVNVWTVNDVIKIKWLIEAGVDGIITDDPLIALKLKNEM